LVVVLATDPSVEISYNHDLGNLDWQCVSFVVAFRRTRGLALVSLQHKIIAIFGSLMLQFMKKHQLWY